MRVRVDQETCIGCGMCASICPEVYEMEMSGKAHAIEGDVPVELEDSAADGRDSCPVEAIE